MWLSKWFLLLQPYTNTFQLQGSWTVLKSCEEMRCIAKYYPNLALVSSHKQMAVYELHDLHPAWWDMHLSAGLPVKSKYSMCCGLWKHVAETLTIMEIFGENLVLPLLKELIIKNLIRSFHNDGCSSSFVVSLLSLLLLLLLLMLMLLHGKLIISCEWVRIWKEEARFQLTYTPCVHYFRLGNLRLTQF